MWCRVPAARDTACYACLKNYGNQFCHHLLARGAAADFMSGVFGYG